MSKKQIEIIKKIEAEARIKKPTVLSSKRSAFLNKGRLSSPSYSSCYPCQPLLLTNNIDWYDPDTNTKGAISAGVGLNHDNDVARFGDKAYRSRGGWCFGPNNTNCTGNLAIFEHEFDGGASGCDNLQGPFVSGTTCSGLSGFTGFGRIWEITNVLSVGTSWEGMEMMDSTTLLVGSTTAGISATGISAIDLSSTTPYPGTAGSTFPATASFLFPTIAPIQGDITYIPSSNSILTSESDHYLRHYDMNGTLLGEVSFLPFTSTTAPGCFGTFCYEGIVHACMWQGVDLPAIGNFWPPGSTNFHPVNLANMTILPSIGDVSVFVKGATSDPSNCIPNACIQPSGDCYNIGDIGPEGGIIFSVPLGHPQNIGLNQTNYYYEVAQDDIAMGGTPNSCFNVTCGEDSFITWGVKNGHATHAQIDINTFVFFWNPGPLPNVPYPGVGSNPPPQQGDVLTAVPPTGTQNLFLDWSGSPITSTTIASITIPPSVQSMGQGPITITVADQFEPTLDPTSQFALPFKFTITSQLPPLCTGFTVTGAEWGVYNKPNIQTSQDFGTGHVNTDNIDNYPPFPGIHPWLDTHDIAATLCKQHGFTNDWFLPSYLEFWIMNYQLGDPNSANYAFGPYAANQLGLNTFGQNSEHFYWTSSKYEESQSALNLQEPDKYSWAFNSDDSSVDLAYRCHALSVRPIRRFECEPTPPCSGCDCVEYNYRDGVGSVDGGFTGGGGFITSPTPDPAQIHWNTTNEGTTPGTPPINLTSDSIIGGDELLFSALNRRDVLGNVHSDADFNNHTGYTISAWDTKYNFIGKWKYSTLFQLQSANTGLQSPKYSYDRPGGDNWVMMRLRDVQHLEGDYPVVYYAGKPDVPNSLGSYTAVFFKIEWDGNTGNYETGCNSTIFGNPHPYYSPGGGSGNNAGRDYPFYCGPLYLNNVYDRHVALPRYATFQPFDLNGSTLLPVYPDIFTANPYLIPPFVPGFSYSAQPISCAGCDYDIGDIGPAGGIIVATPNMASGTVTPDGIDWNPTNFYYELSSDDLNVPSPPNPMNCEWGNYGGSGGQYTHPGIIGYNDEFGVGEGEDNTSTMITNMSPIQTFASAYNGLDAFTICDDYSFGGYDDWFLPSVQEWALVRNNIPSIWDGISNWSKHYWTSNFLYEFTGTNDSTTGAINPPRDLITQSGIIPIIHHGWSGEPNPFGVWGNINRIGGNGTSGLCVNVDEPITHVSGNPNLITQGQYIAGMSVRSTVRGVRAMRKFECAPTPIYGCTDPMSSTYDPLATIDDGSCVYENHCWSMCGVKAGRTWYQVLDPWLDTGNPINWGPIAMENNPLGVTTPPFSTNPAVNQDYTAFYDWMITQIPTLAIGDTFKFETSGYGMAIQTAQGLFSCDIICFKYRGVQVWDISLPIINNGYLLPTITPSNCCVSGGSSSIVRPTNESDPRAVKMKINRIRENFPDDGTMLDIKSLY